MNTDPELPELVVTRGEKLLATVLAIFLLVGGLWVYFEPLDRDTGFVETEQVQPTASQQRALRTASDARRRLRDARADQRRDLKAYELAREDYRTDLDAGTPAGATRRAFERAGRRLDASRRAVRDATAAVRRAAPAAHDARRRLAATQRAADHRADRELTSQHRTTFLLRLAWCLAWIGIGMLVLTWLRRRRSRYFVAGAALVSAATAQAVTMAGDYITDDLDLARKGPLVLSIAGVAASLLALVGLERYLKRRMPRRRVRRGECPFCAFPARGTTRCEGCGRELFADCSTCSAERRVGTPHCGVCGAA